MISQEANKEENYSKLISDLQCKIDVLKVEENKIKQEQSKRYMEKKIIEKELTEKKILLENYKIKYSMNTIFYQDIRNIPNFDLLTENDLFKISKAIDKRDYNLNSDVKYPRFIDLENVVRYIIQVKQIYPLWELTDINKYGKIDTYPPKNCYKYQFTTPEGLLFSNVNNLLPFE
jgi:hypothetical protein